MKLTNVALAFAALSLSVLSVPIAIVDERSHEAKADAIANADHAYPMEVEKMLARLEKRGPVAQANANHDHA